MTPESPSSGYPFGRAALALHRRAPTATGPLALVEVFINTRAYPSMPDQLGDARALGHWLTAHGLATADTLVLPSDVLVAIEVREALRALILANTTGDERPTAALEVLSRLGAQAPVHPTFDVAGVRLESDGQGVVRALSRLLAIVAVAMIDGSWAHLKACRSEACRSAFYDATRNHSGQWCTPALCGVRERARMFRARHRRSRR